jgi:hypothetical protein
MPGPGAEGSGGEERLAGVLDDEFMPNLEVHGLGQGEEREVLRVVSPDDIDADDELEVYDDGNEEVYEDDDEEEEEEEEEEVAEGLQVESPDEMEDVEQEEATMIVRRAVSPANEMEDVENEWPSSSEDEEFDVNRLDAVT